MDVNHLVSRADQCRRETALEYYNALAGIKDRLEIVAILAKYPELYSRETYDFVVGLGPDEVPDERQRRFLRQVFTMNYFTDRLKEQSEHLTNAEMSATVKLDGDELPYRAVQIVLSNEPDYGKRGKLDTAYLKELDALNPLREEIDAGASALAKELGYTSIIHLCEVVRGMRIYPLRDLLTQFLDDSTGVYEERLGHFAAQADGLTRDKLRQCDIGFMMRANRFDPLFPPADMVGALKRTLAGLGIDLDAQDNVTLDIEPRPQKAPRAFCIGIDAPRDVRLVLQPRGGLDDYSTLFHEAGHLQFGAHMDAAGWPFYRTHGDTSVHEGYAFLLQHLVDDPVWWREIMHAEPDGYPEFGRFHRLYFIRRYAAKLHYEVEYFERGGGSGLSEAYSRWLKQGTGIAYPRERYLDDFDGMFYVLQYLQAWIWEVQLRAHLKREFGEAWFTNRAAGDFLKDLWREGMKYDVWEIAERLGYPGLDLEPLKAELLG